MLSAFGRENSINTLLPPPPPTPTTAAEPSLGISGKDSVWRGFKCTPPAGKCREPMLLTKQIYFSPCPRIVCSLWCHSRFSCPTAAVTCPIYGILDSSGSSISGKPWTGGAGSVPWCPLLGSALQNVLLLCSPVFWRSLEGRVVGTAPVLQEVGTLCALFAFVVLGCPPSHSDH